MIPALSYKLQGNKLHVCFLYVTLVKNPRHIQKLLRIMPYMVYLDLNMCTASVS